MPEDVQHLARALIAAHGVNAIYMAEQAARNTRALGSEAKTAEWEKVIAEINAMQKNGVTNGSL